MNCNKQRPDKLSVLSMAAALAVSVLVAVILVLVGAASMQRLRMTRAVVLEAPPSGTLLGRNALDGSEWAPRSSENHTVIMFNIAPAGKIGDIEFWRDVASLTHLAAPGFEFVGVCSRRELCSLPPDTNGVLTLLSSMDPVQMRALAVVTNNGRFNAYMGSFQRSLAVHGDKRALADEIASISMENQLLGGT